MKNQRFCEDVWNDVNFKIYDIRETSHINRISSCSKKIALEFNNFYTKKREKRLPYNILNESTEKREWFMIGFYAADGNRKNKQKNPSFSEKHKINMSGLNYLCQSLGLKTCINMRDDKFKIFDYD